MANLPETPTFDAGVYQLETTDPVQGGSSGVSNAPLKNLANRTAYLKQRVDNIESGSFEIPGYAKLASPALTGSPTAPTQPLGDNTTKIANTAFVQATLGGRLLKNVAGGSNVTLTAVEAGSGILEFTGALTGNIAVIVPTAPTRPWIIKNGTSGAYTLTIKTAAGTGVVVSQGKQSVVYTDGTNVVFGNNDINIDLSAYAPKDSPVLTGNPTAPTPAQFDNDTSLATTAWVNSRGVEFSDYRQITDTNATLTASDCGKLIQVSSAAGNLTITLPLSTSVPSRSVITLVCTATNPVTLACQGADRISANGATISDNKIRSGDTVTLVAAPGNTWIVASGSMGLRDSAQFGSSLAASGYQKLPSGLIIQWGSGTTSAAGVAAVAYPITFPTGTLQSFVSDRSSSASSGSNDIVSCDEGTASGMNVYSISDAGVAKTTNFKWLAIGY